MTSLLACLEAEEDLRRAAGLHTPGRGGRRSGHKRGKTAAAAEVELIRAVGRRGAVFYVKKRHPAIEAFFHFLKEGEVIVERKKTGSSAPGGFGALIARATSVLPPRALACAGVSVCSAMATRWPALINRAR